MSAKTGTAPQATTMLAVEGQVRAGTTTSSPGCSSRARRVAWSAPVPEEKARACFAPTAAANSASSRATRGPLVIHPERRHSTTSAISSSPMSGRENGRVGSRGNTAR